jgi:hypothetical protein
VYEAVFDASEVGERVAAFCEQFGAQGQLATEVRR